MTIATVAPTTVNIPSLHSRAMLAYISVSSWSARKLDRKATDKVTKGAGATTDAARVNKHLLASADASLKKIVKIGGDARRYLEANSLPWDDAGNRLVSNDKAIDVVATVTNMQKDYDAAVEEFVTEYPMLRAQALANLGDMGDNNEYPQPDIVREKFGLRISLNPLPTGFGDARMGLNPEQVKFLEIQFEARVRMQFNVAITDAWRRLRADVESIAERMTIDVDGNRKIFRDSLFANARETCALLRSLNVFDEPNLNQIRFEVEQYLCSADAAQIRSSDHAASTIKFQADAILDRMKDLLGE